MPADLGTIYEVVVQLSLEENNLRVLHEPPDLVSQCKEFCKYKDRCDKTPKIFILPDLVVIDKNDEPVFFTYVTHWRSSDTSHYKFWRTVEELFEHKIHFLNKPSINVVMEATRRSDGTLWSDGWREGLLYAMDWIFDDSIFFHPPNLTAKIEEFRRKIDTDRYEKIYRTLKNKLNTDSDFRSIITNLSHEIRNISKNLGMKREFESLWEMEREYCSNRQDISRKIRNARWRRGTLIFTASAITLRRDCNKTWNFFISLKPFSRTYPTKEISKLRNLVVRRIKGKPIRIVEMIPVLPNDYSFSLNDELTWFIDELKAYDKKTRNAILEILDRLRKYVINKNTTKNVCLDLQYPERVCKKVDFFMNNFPRDSREIFDSITKCRNNASFLSVVSENINWLFELYMIASNNSTYRLAPKFNRNFRNQFNFTLRKVYNNTTRMLIRQIYNNEEIAFKDTSRDWLHECLLIFSEVFHQDLTTNIDQVELQERYFERKTKRITGAQPDINSLSEIVEGLMDTRTNTEIEKGPVLKSIFSNYLEAINPRWSRIGNTGFPYFVKLGNVKVPLKIIAATGRNHVDDKRKEMCGRLKSSRYIYDPSSQTFKKKVEFKKYAIVLDGDWSSYDGENLIESGYEVLQVRDLPRLEKILSFKR